MEATEILAMIITSFAGGVLGAALGALPAFVFMGFVLIGGEALRIAGVNIAGMELGGYTFDLAFGAFFGPHITFAAGAAAAAYAAKKGYFGPGFGGNWGAHPGKNILVACAGKHTDVLFVGGLFGVLGWAIFYVSDLLALPWDPIAVAVVLSALVHRLVFRFAIIGEVRGKGIFDISPFERGDTHATDGANSAPEERLDVEPWLPWFYKWGNVAIISAAFGALAGLTFYWTGSMFLAFGFSAATLIFLNLSWYDDMRAPQVAVPVTHHVTLPAATAVAAYGGFGVAAEISAVQAEIVLLEGVLIGALFGIIGGLLGEAAQRVFFMHGDTHWDPPATSIVLTTLLIAILHMVGVFESAGFVPIPI